MGHPYSARPVADTHVWLTPPEIIGALGPFDLDPCAAPSPRPWDTALRHIELPEDGLTAAWSGRVWCNPPFGRETAKWLRRIADTLADRARQVPAAREALRALIGEATLRNENGNPVAEIAGSHLAMVAGAGFESYLTAEPFRIPLAGRES